MPYTTKGKNRMLQHLAGGTAINNPITHAALHTAAPSEGTPAEVSGGSPAYARKAVTFEATAGTELAGSLDVTNQPVFDVPAGTTVSHVGFWSAVTGGDLLAYADVTDEAFAAQGTYTLTDCDLHLNL